jgi:hypothetical protein
MPSPLRNKDHPLPTTRIRPETLARWERMRKMGMKRYLLIWSAFYGSAGLIGVLIAFFTNATREVWLLAAFVPIAVIGGFFKARSQWITEEEKLAAVIEQSQNLHSH